MKVLNFKVLDAKTGNVKILELKETKFPSLKRPSPKGETRTGNF